MLGLVTEPGVARSTRVTEVPAPASGGVRLRVLEVGVCGTDREISEGLFGVRARRCVVARARARAARRRRRGRHGFTRGDLVTATVRRSCRHCIACEHDEPDSCLTGDYSERGITRLDGFARELVSEDAGSAHPCPAPLGRLGVLSEPASICDRALRHARTIGGRQPWELERALVLGAGAIGMLATLSCGSRASRCGSRHSSRRATSSTAAGAHYVSTGDTRRSRELGRFDLVIEAAGDAQLMAGSLGLLRRSGVACLLGIDPRSRRVEIDGPGSRSTRSSRTASLFGSVNAQRRRTGWSAVDALDRARGRWGDALEAFVGLRVPLDRFEDAFALPRRQGDPRARRL